LWAGLTPHVAVRRLGALGGSVQRDSGARPATSCQDISVARLTPIAIACAALVGNLAAAAEPADAWLERFDVVTGCPNANEFRSAIARRVSLPLDAAFDGLRLELSIEAEASSTPQTLLGKLTITDRGAVSSTREVRASACGELIEALSLVAALGADVARRGRPSDAPLSAPSDTTGSAAAPEDLSVTALVSTPPDTFRIGPELYVLVQDVATPDTELGIGLGLSVALPSRGLWAPWLELGGYRVQSDETSIGAASIQARFALIAARAVVCPLRLPARGIWSLQPCVELDIGRLSGSGGGSAITRPTEQGGLWASSALSLRAELEPWAPLRLSASFGAVVPWTRHEFFFAPDTVAFRVPALGFRGTIAGSLLF
jgi:hypothetical protein